MIDRAGLAVQLALVTATLAAITFSLIAPRIATRYNLAFFGLMLVTVLWSFIPFGRPRNLNELFASEFWTMPAGGADQATATASTPTAQEPVGVVVPIESPTAAPVTIVPTRLVEPAPTPRPTPLPTAPPAASITVWAMAGSSEEAPKAKALGRLVNEYKQVAPDTTINLVFVPYTRTCAAACKLFEATGTENSPDLIEASDPDVATLYEKHTIVAMDYLIAKTLSTNVLDDFQKPLLDSGRFARYDNQQLSFPFARSVEMLYYNKPALTKAGFPDGPRTWSEFQTACDRIASAGSGMQCYVVQASADAFIPAVLGRGGDPNRDFSVNLFDSPQTRAALNFDVNNIKAGKAKVYATRDSSWRDDFAAGKVAMLPMVPTDTDADVNAAVNGAFEIGAAALPSDVTPQKSLLVGTNLAIVTKPRSAARELAAWNFVKWLSEPAQSAAWTVDTSSLPVRQSVLGDPNFQAFLAKTPRFQVALGMIPSAVPGPSTVQWVDGRPLLEQWLTKTELLEVAPTTRCTRRPLA